MIKRLWSIKITVHPLSLIYYSLALLTGYFKWYLISMAIVLIHEYHHAFIACFFNFKVRRIHLYPFGAFLEILDFDRHPYKCKILVLIGGLASHLLIYLGLNLLYSLGISQTSYDYALMMNQYVFLFNLLPIWPLDGSKLLELILVKSLGYKKGVKLNLSISGVILMLGMLLFFKINHLMIYIFLGYSLFKEGKNRMFLYALNDVLIAKFE